MARGRSEQDVRAHIASMSKRTYSDIQVLADALQGRSWPGGPSDRIEPAALSWLRRWRPKDTMQSLPVCECASGRCLVCN
jgi:hypothetical protein